MIRLLGASQDHFGADGVKALLENEKDFERLGRAGNPLALMNLVHELKPDVVVMCARFAGNDTASLVSEYVRIFKETGIVVLSSSHNPDTINEMLSTGVNGYIHCTSSSQAGELFMAICEVAQSRRYIGRSVLNILNNAAPYFRPHSQSHHVNLGHREIEVLQKVATGNTSKMIAKQLCISTSTVEVHRRNIMNKLKMHNIADLTRYAIRQKLIEI